MTKYLIKRLIRGLISVVIAVAAIMILVYSLSNKNDIFRGDSNYVKKQSNERTTYRYEKWEEYGYLDYVTYAEYLTMLVNSGEIDAETKSKAVKFGRTEGEDSAIARTYIAKFKAYYEGKGYTIQRMDADITRIRNGGQQQLFAYKDVPTLTRLWKFFTGILEVDTIHYVENDEDLVGERGLTFTFYDPVYGGKKFSPAIIGNGTKYKYLLYFDNKFPFIHQNVVKLHLGQSFAIHQGIDVAETLVEPQGAYEKQETFYPTGLVEVSSDNLHTAKYSEMVDLSVDEFRAERFTDKYTDVDSNKSAYSRMAISFIIGILSSIFAYLIGIPAGIAMARHKDSLYDKFSTAYIVFILAVPSLAYIFMFRELGIAVGLPGRYDSYAGAGPYVLPIVSLALPAIAGLMRWLRRFMIDQMNSDYVKFARSGGMSESGIFVKHVFKNAVIPLARAIPGTIITAFIGGFITETVYYVPGTGRMLTDSITQKDNAVIIGLAGFYTLLSILSVILGDILMAMMDPRISFSDKAR